VAREVVATALRHSAPRRVTLVLKGLGPRVVLEVAEDGGAAQVEATQWLLRMRERLALVDGTFDVRREPSGGTRAVAAVALTEDRDT